MKILIVSDAWLPQVNGVVRTLHATQDELEKAGHSVRIVGPELKRWSALPLPFYREITIELFARKRLAAIMDDFKPDSVHIATEGPLGLAARRECQARGWSFTTAYHTRFPEYFSAHLCFGVGQMAKAIAYAYLRWFHRASACVMAPTMSVAKALVVHGFANVGLWARGVDTEKFLPYGKYFEPFDSFMRPILLYVGRVSAEKNIEAFLKVHTNGTKVVIGGGPDFARLKSAYRDTKFLGPMEHDKLPKAYAAADLFVFPSLTDTFGLVLLEACACGVRIAAYPATGPKDIFDEEEARQFCALDDDLGMAIDKALSLPENPQLPRRFAEKHSWVVCTAQFLSHLTPISASQSQK